MAQRYPTIPTSEFREFVRVVRRLRRDCPWDRKQTHRSLREPLIEETYEVVDALDRNNSAALCGEIGDLLLHVVLQATIAEQSGEFTLQEVLREIREKLVRRHPHVFASVRVSGPEEVKRNWEIIKLKEGRRSLLEGIPRHLPALQHAHRIQQRAAKVGFDWEKAEDVWAKVEEEMSEFRETLQRRERRRREEEFGDLLFALVNYARFVGVDPEQSLRAANKKFTRRFRYVERALHRRGKRPHESTLAEMDGFWNDSKRGRVRRNGR